MKELLEIMRIANLILPDFLTRHELELGGRKGVYVFLKETAKRSKNYLTGEVVGDLPTAKIAEKMRYAFEKLTRLDGDEWLTTFPTQNYADGKYGGGVRSYIYLIAVSGFPPHLDHAFAVEVLREAGQLGSVEEKNIQKEFEEYQHTGIS